VIVIGDNNMKKVYDEKFVNANVSKENPLGEVRCEYLRPGQLLYILDKFPVAYQPIGTLEWHGRHNPLGCDAIKAQKLCEASAKITGGVVMPAIYFSTDGYKNAGNGIGLGMDAFAGTMLPGSFYKADNELMKNLMLSACNNYLQRGFKLVVMVSGHNPRAQQYLMDEVCYIMKTDDGREPVCFTMEYMVLDINDPRRHTDHAGYYETSMMLNLVPEYVNIAANDSCAIENLGVMTDKPVKEASKAEGEICLRSQTEGLVKFVKEKYAKL